jgi:hypothetical protein
MVDYVAWQKRERLVLRELDILHGFLAKTVK